MTEFQSPMLSIVCLAYNHEKFIRNCLEGFVMQKTNFPFQIVIHDDASTDRTAAIIREYEAKYPKLFKPIYQSENQYSKEKGEVTRITYNAAKGKYIALCEGDDYWTDPLKLQKQVDVLEKNKSLTGCFHNSEERYWNDYSKASKLFVTFSEGREYDIVEAAKNNKVPTASIVFRTPVPKEVFTEEFLKLPVGDWPLHLLNLRNGNYYYIPQIMSVRNLYTASTWGLQDHKENIRKVIYTYQIFINSNWFSKNTNLHLKSGMKNLENELCAKKKNDFFVRIINKIISILHKFN